MERSKTNTIRRKVCLLLMVLCMGSSLVSAQTFSQTLASLGYEKSKCVDWSDSTFINIPLPTCAYLNFKGFSSFPVLHTTVRKATMEVYDGNGNYFLKKALVAVQGQSSIQWEKRNFKVDFCEDNWVGDVTPDIQIGDWVEQDGFHFKAFYLDFFRGTGIVGYQLYDQISKDRGEHGRIWERADNIDDPDERALCHPDAFPCVVFLNDKFYGVFSWQLKKHRKNMNMKKNTPEHIHIDGTLMNNATLFDGNVNWTKIEVRNPKNLYTMNGEIYDGDDPEELMDESSAYYDLDTDSKKIKEYKKHTAKVKHYIQDLSRYNSEIQSLVDNKSGTAAIRAAIGERFDVVSIIDYIIHNIVSNNFDGTQKNYQWFTYDGKKWFVAPYDLDSTFGYFPVNFIIFEPQYYYIYPMANWNYTNFGPLKWVEKYFKNDIRERYAFLRDNGILNAETVESMFESWYYAVGEDNYRKEWTKWPQSPCLKETIPNSQWTLVEYNYSKYKNLEKYSDTVTYHAGDCVAAQYRIWKAKSQVKGVRPYVQVGCKDSLSRIKPWMQKRLQYVDIWMNYSFTPVLVSYTLSITSSGWSTVCVPFAFDVPEGLVLYDVIGRDKKGQLLKRQVEHPEANKPYLVRGATGDYLLVGTTEEPEEMSDDYLVNHCLHGCMAETFAPQGSYVLQNHNGVTAFYPVRENGLIKMGAHRAYLVLDDDDSEANPFIGLGDDDFADDIAILPTSTPIIGIYKTNGVRADKMTKGVNIVKYANGHTVKVVVR